MYSARAEKIRIEMLVSSMVSCNRKFVSTRAKAFHVADTLSIELDTTFSINEIDKAERNYLRRTK